MDNLVANILILKNKSCNVHRHKIITSLILTIANTINFVLTRMHINLAIKLMSISCKLDRVNLAICYLFTVVYPCF